MRRKTKKKHRGFTIVELIIVMAIIVILSAIAIPKFNSVIKSANLKADIADAKTIASATSALIMQGTINESSTPIDLSSSEDAAFKIVSYLENKPEPKGIKESKFIIKTVNGDVKVYISSSASNLTDVNQIYPKPQTNTNNIWYGGTVQAAPVVSNTATETK